MTNIFIFTYGTLMEGGRNYEKYLRGIVFSTKKAYVLGELYHLVNKGYPGFIQKNNKKVYGEIHEILDNKKLLAVLAELESCNNEDDSFNEYIRRKLEVFTLDDKFFGKLPVYVYNPSSILSKNDIRIEIPSGDWKKYITKYATDTRIYGWDDI